MKNRMISAITLIAVAFVSCGENKDAQLQAFVADMDQVTREIVLRVNQNPTETGIDEAQGILDQQKIDLQLRYERLKQLRVSDLSSDALKILTESTRKDIEAVGDLQIMHAEKAVSDEIFARKMNKLYRDYSSIYGG